MHQTIEPPILYFGTPVILVTTINDDGTFNLAPNSSVFWLGWRCMVGMAALSKTTQNLLRTGECVLNLASISEVDGVNTLALTTGLDPVPTHKRDRGYRYEPDKFGIARMTSVASEAVASPRVAECPVQLECVVESTHRMAEDDALLRGHVVCFELRVLRVHVAEEILASDQANRIDPDKWRPLIMSFQRFYGLGKELRDSRLALIPEHAYRSPDVDRARSAPS